MRRIPEVHLFQPKLYVVILAVQFVLTQTSCKSRTKTPNSSNTLSAESADSCFPSQPDAGNGISFPQNFQAPQETFASFNQDTVWRQGVDAAKQSKPEIFSAGATKSLAEEEVGAIALYSGEEYKAVNGYLRDGNVPERYKWLICLAVSGMRKLPTFSGTVYRGTHLRPEVLQKYKEAFQSRAPFQELGFVSTTMDSDVLDDFSRNGNFTIESVNGVIIETVSVHPEEREVLFVPGTRFQITDLKEKELDGEPGATIFMNEATPQVSIAFFNWDENQPSDYDHEINCVETKSTGKWHDEDCYATRAFACQSIAESGRWVLSAVQGTWNEYADKCPSGYRFSVPKNQTEVGDLRKVLGETGSAWINLTDQDREGSYLSK
jgi:hypothetical protein